MKVFSIKDIDRVIEILGAKFKGSKQYSVFSALRRSEC